MTEESNSSAAARTAGTKADRRRALLGCVGWSVVMAVSNCAYMGFVFVNAPLCEAMGYSATQFSLFFSFMSIGAMAGMGVYGKLMAKFGIKPLAVVGSVAQFLVFLVLAFCPAVYVVWVAAFVYGFVNTFVGFVPYNIYVSSWVGRGVGKMLSVGNMLMNGLGIVISPVVASFVQGAGVVSACLSVGAAMGIVCLTSTLLLTSDLPAKYGASQVDLGKAEQAEAPAVEAQDVSGGEGSTASARRLLRVPGVVCALVLPALLGMVSTIYATYGPQIFMGFGLDYMGASYAYSIAQIAAMAYLFLFGVVNDRFGTRLAVIVFTVPAAVACYASPLLSGWAAALVLALLVRTVMFCNMYSGVVYPRLFGQTAAGDLMGWGGSLMGLQGIVAAPLAAALSGGTEFAGTLVLCGCLCVVALLLNQVVMGKGTERAVRAASDAETPAPVPASEG